MRMNHFNYYSLHHTYDSSKIEDVHNVHFHIIIFAFDVFNFNSKHAVMIVDQLH